MNVVLFSVKWWLRNPYGYVKMQKNNQLCIVSRKSKKNDIHTKGKCTSFRWSNIIAHINSGQYIRLIEAEMAQLILTHKNNQLNWVQIKINDEKTFKDKFYIAKSTDLYKTLSSLYRYN